MKIAYLVDSSICLSENDRFLESEDCFFIPLHLIVNNKDYLDNDEIDRNKIINDIGKAKKVGTSQPSLLEVDKLIDNIIEQGYDVLVCALIGSGLSGTQNLIYSCALNKNITVVNLDSKGAGPMQVKAIKMFKEEILLDNSLLDVQAKVQHMLDVSNCYAVVDDLSYLKRGGRINATSATLGSFLKVKPLVMCSKEAFGKVIPIGKVRLRSKAYEKLVELATEEIDLDEYNLAIAHFGAIENAKSMQEIIEVKYPDQIVDIVDLCFAIGAHTGPGSLVLFVTRK